LAVCACSGAPPESHITAAIQHIVRNDIPARLSFEKPQPHENYHELKGLTDTILPFNISGMWPIGHGFLQQDVTYFT
jgi:hypothetical protein